MAHAHDDHADGYNVHAHISSTKFNAAILGVLIMLTGLTVGAYRIHLGEWNLFVAVLIATIKAGLVMGFFMHLHWEKTFNKIVFLGSFIFVAVFLGYTVNDTSHRGRDSTISGVRVDPATGLWAHGTAAAIVEHGEFQPLRPAAPEPAAEAAPAVEAPAEAAPAEAPTEAEAAPTEAEAAPTEAETAPTEAETAPTEAEAAPTEAVAAEAPAE